MQLYNTLTRKKEEFIPLNPDDKTVGMYVCGPTVYGPMHLGHARTYVVFDTIRRYLEYSGYNITFISNITDVHDSIIKTAIEENSSIKSIANKFTQQFFNELGKLKIKKANKYPAVSDYIDQIIKFIEILIDKNFAYESEGSIYFDISKFPNYGKLSRRKLEKAKSGTRVDLDKFEKDEAVDFALWKKTSGDEEKVGASWDSPWGKGRPGWHIECSAMSKELLGEQFDIHGGANDLMFPHHENEIAQSEAASGKSPFVKYWMHSGLLTINGQKMSKSLKNFISLEDIFKKYNPAVLRFLVLSSHYRSPVDYSDEAMKRAKEGLKKINIIFDKIHHLKTEKEKPTQQVFDLIKISQKSIKDSLDDDFNTPKALSELFKFIKEINILIDKGDLSSIDANNVNKFLEEINQIFQIIEEREEIEIPANIQGLLNQRRKAREGKDWNTTDKLRDEIAKLGFIVEDTQMGQIVRKKINHYE